MVLLLIIQKFCCTFAVYLKTMILHLFLFNFLGPEMLVVLFAILLLFGGKKIPELMKGLGSGIREFNKAKKEVGDKLQEGMRDDSEKDTESKS